MFVVSTKLKLATYKLHDCIQRDNKCKIGKFTDLHCSPMVWETSIQSQVMSYQRLKNWYLIPPCLTFSIIRYGSRVTGAIQEKELHPPLHLGVVAI